MRQPVWLPHFWRKDAIMLPYLSLFGRLMPTYGVLGMAGLGFGLLAALLRCKRFGLSRDDCAYLYILGRWGPWWGPSCSTCSPPAPAGCGAAPALGGARGVLCPLSLRRHGVLRRLFRRCGGGLGAAKYLRLRLSDFFPVLVPALPLVHAVGRVGCFAPAAAMDGRLRPLGHSIHSRHCRAQRRAPSSGAALGGGGGAGDFRLSALVCRAGRRAGADAPGLCVLLCPGAVCVGVVSGDPARGCTGPSPRLSGSAWLFWPWPWRGLWRGGSSKNTSVKGYPSKRATETRAIQRIHKNHRKRKQPELTRQKGPLALAV